MFNGVKVVFLNNFDPVNELFRVFMEGGIDLRYGRLSGCENVAKVIFNEVKVV